MNSLVGAGLFALLLSAPVGSQGVARSSHPPVGERIDFCNAYRPWERGKPGEFEDLFRGSRGVPAAVAEGGRR